MARKHTASDFEVKASAIPDCGQGLFASAEILRGDVIGRYEGLRLTDDEANSEPYVHSRYLVWVCKDCWIDGSRGGNYTRFINHSKSPNCELVVSTRWKSACIKAIKKILPGQELYFDYGDEYWNVLEEEYTEAPNSDEAHSE